MDSLAEAVKAADGPWPVIAIAIIGLYVLAWRYGGQILTTAKESKVIAQQAHDEAKHISSSIVTNHGSKNLGDAVDRLTENLAYVNARLDKIELDQNVIHRLFTITRAPEE